MRIKVKAADPFKVLYNLPEGTSTVIMIGGRGGMKTYEASKFIAFSAAIRKKRCAVLRDEHSTVKESILNEILLRYDAANAGGKLDARVERLDTGLKDRETGASLVFTKGFRASSTAKKANLKSISDVDIAIVEEAEDITDEDKFNTFADSIRKQGSLIIIVLNTPDVGHWIVKRYFNTVAVTNEAGEVIDGYYDITPKEIPGFVCVKTSFEDNPHLPDHIVDRYRAYGNPESPFYNLHYYLTAIRGYASTGRKGQILKKVKPISLADYLALPYREYYGQDFGTASPAGLVGVKMHRNQVWARQLNYQPMNTLALGILYSQLQFGPADLIVADSAEPKTISKLRGGFRTDTDPETLARYPALVRGFNVVAARKGPDSVTAGLDLLDQKELFVVEDSADMWNEVRNYVYATDKNGAYTNDPIDDFNHLIDPLRYVVDYVTRSASAGSTSGSRA